MIKEFTEYVIGAHPNLNLIALKSSADMYNRLIHLPGAAMTRHVSVGPYLVLPATRENCMAVESLSAPTFVAPEYAQMRSTIMMAPQELMDSWNLYAPEMRRPLMRHQTEFCAIAHLRRGMLNASEQGTGKTAATAALIGCWKPKRFLVVAPKSICLAWPDEFYLTLKTPIPMVPVIDGSLRYRKSLIDQLLSLDEPMGISVNYEALQHYGDTLKEAKFDVAVFDESWYVKNPEAAMTLEAIDIAWSATRVICMAGTPVNASIGGMWSQLCMSAGRVNPFGTYEDWMADHSLYKDVYLGSGKKKKAVGVRNAARLMAQIHWWYYRASKDACLDLPLKLEPRRIRLTLPDAVYDLYRSYEDGDNEVDLTTMAASGVAQIRMQQIADGFLPRLADDPQPEPWGPDNPLETVTHPNKKMPDKTIVAMECDYLPSPKLEWILDYARDVLRGNKTTRVIFWFRFNPGARRAYEEVRKILGPSSCALVIGDMKVQEIERIKASFNSRDPEGVQCIFAQIAKMCNGHNLQAGDVHIHVSHTWHIIQRQQSIDRSHRQGRVGDVETIDLIAAGIDDDILFALDSGIDFALRVSPDTSPGKELFDAEE